MESSLTYKKEIAEGTMLFAFKKPEGFTHTAGQSVDITLINPPETDAEGNTRAYSIACDPSSPDIIIATRMRDTAFKRTLRDMEVGTHVEIKGPFGSFVLHEKHSRPAVFIAGGIGITPFNAMIHDAAARALPHRLVLLYTNRRPEDAAFLDELSELSAKTPNFTFVPTMTEMEKSSRPWSGATGHIDAALIGAHVDQSEEPIFYLAGPAGMVKAMRQVLQEMGVSTDDIRTEEFSGY